MADFEVYVPRVINNRGTIGIGSKDILVSDIRDLQRRLRDIDPDLRKQLMRDAKTVGKQAESAIKSAIPSTSPLRLSNSRGRLAWDHQVNAKGVAMPADKTMVQFRTSRSGSSAVTSLVSVKVMAPMTVIADIAGRSGRAIDKGYKNSGYSRPFMRNGVQVRMKLNGQGAGMIRKLGGGASRFAWPAIEKDKVRLESEVRAIINRYTKIANRSFN
jgi:hypothetical protein